MPNVSVDRRCGRSLGLVSRALFAAVAGRWRDAWGLGLSLGLYAHDAAVACSALEHDGAVGQRIEGVIGTHTHVLAGVVSGAALANDDVAGYASLAAPDLNTQTL